MNYLIYFWLLIEIVYLIIHFKSVIAGRPVYRMDRLNIAPALLAAGISGTVGLAQAGIGIAQKIKAARMARGNIRPELEDNPYVEEAYDLTGSMAQNGLSDASMQAYLTNNDRNLSSSINAILKSGGSANNIADLYDSSDNSLRSLALANDEMKMRNVSQFLQSGLKPKAEQERDQWYLNKYVPFQDTAALAANLSEQGMNNIFKGVNTAGGAAMGMLNAKTYPGETAGAGAAVADPLPTYKKITMGTNSFGGINTDNMQLPGSGSAGINPALLNLQMIMQGYNTDRAPGPARFNPLTNRWE